MVYHWIPLNTIEYHWIPLNTIECHWIPLNTIEYHWIPLSTIGPFNDISAGLSGTLNGNLRYHWTVHRLENIIKKHSDTIQIPFKYHWPLYPLVPFNGIWMVLFCTGQITATSTAVTTILCLWSNNVYNKRIEHLDRSVICYRDGYDQFNFKSKTKTVTIQKPTRMHDVYIPCAAFHACAS